ncbi:MAG: PASTA domain-containing protein [Flavobacterium sp.]
MSLRKYLTSRVFFTQIAIAIAIIAALIFAFIFWLDSATNHGHEIEVPDLRKLTEEQVKQKVEELSLNYVLLDSVDFQKDYPKFSVVEQDPLPGTKVKEDRKIYIKINSSGFTSVVIPDLIEKTFRQASPTLLALGLEIGQITYVPYLGKDMVRQLKQNGKILKAGDKVMKTSKIDVVLGDGKIAFDENEIDDSLENVNDGE